MCAFREQHSVSPAGNTYIIIITICNIVNVMIATMHLLSNLTSWLRLKPNKVCVCGVYVRVWCVCMCNACVCVCDVWCVWYVCVHWRENLGWGSCTVSMCVYLWLCVCTCVCVHVWCVCVCVMHVWCMYVCICMCVCVYVCIIEFSARSELLGVPMHPWQKDFVNHHSDDPGICVCVCVCVCVCMCEDVCVYVCMFYDVWCMMYDV